jgi:hypothetical protein
MRTFEELRGPSDTWCTSLAYWMGVFRGDPTSNALLEVAGALSLQYDFEEQADCYGSVFPEDASWPAMFRPVAPIQLTQGWSPVPRAIEILGPPHDEAFEGEGPRTIAVVWSTPADVKAIARRVRSQRPEQLDEKRFLELLTAAVLRAAEKHASVVLIARPGWSYEHAPRVSRQTASMMTKAGFVVTTRTPRGDD